MMPNRDTRWDEWRCVCVELMMMCGNFKKQQEGVHVQVSVFCCRLRSRVETSLKF